MTHFKCAELGFLALYTMASTLAQASASEVSRAEVSGTIASPCSRAATTPEGNAADAPGDVRMVSSLAQQLPTCLTAREQGQFTERFVNERLAVWRRRLKLENWQISVVMIRRSELKSKTLGGIRWDKGMRSAVISVLDASDYRLALREMLDDMEFTIVHELVHLELASLPRSEASRSSEEQAVNKIAEALLKLDRQK